MPTLTVAPIPMPRPHLHTEAPPMWARTFAESVCKRDCQASRSLGICEFISEIKASCFPLHQKDLCVSPTSPSSIPRAMSVPFLGPWQQLRMAGHSILSLPVHCSGKLLLCDFQGLISKLLALCYLHPRWQPRCGYGARNSPVNYILQDVASNVILLLWGEGASRWNAASLWFIVGRAEKVSREVFSVGVRGSVDLPPHQAGWSSRPRHLHFAASGPSTEDLFRFCLDSASGERGSEREREGGDRQGRGRE